MDYAGRFLHWYSRRGLQLWSLAALLVCILIPRAEAADSFSYQKVIDQAGQLAAQPYQNPAGQVPDFLLKLDYDSWRDIRFKPKQALWRTEGLPFQVQFFHPGLYYDRLVKINIVDFGAVKPVAFSRDLFDYGKNSFKDKVPAASALPGLGCIASFIPENIMMRLPCFSVPATSAQWLKIRTMASQPAGLLLIRHSAPVKNSFTSGNSGYRVSPTRWRFVLRGRRWASCIAARATMGEGYSPQGFAHSARPFHGRARHHHRAQDLQRVCGRGQVRARHRARHHHRAQGLHRVYGRGQVRARHRARRRRARTGDVLPHAVAHKRATGSAIRPASRHGRAIRSDTRPPGPPG